MVKIFLVMHIITHFPINCKLYLQSKKLLATLSQHRSGGSFAASQNTEKSSLSFFGTCAAAACKGVNVNGNTWSMCQTSKTVPNQITQTIPVSS